ncbi:MAG: hypothetical protein HYX53_13890 [Chloroflexi bacterium]|nr:hypothetical protein [Chloroflexota bacterium]
MKFAFLAGAGLALLTGPIAVVAAQTATSTPVPPPTAVASVSPPAAPSVAVTGTASATARPSTTPAPTATATPQPPPGPTPGPIGDGSEEPPFLFGTVQQSLVAELRAVGGFGGGRTHYVTLDEDQAGTVRVRYSLFSFPEGFYVVYIYGRGSCADRGPVIAQLRGVSLGPEAPGSLALVFNNVNALSLTGRGGPSIFDADGTSLVLAKDYSEEQPYGVPVACAVLSAAPGAPDTGTGLQPGRRGALPWALPVVVASAGVGLSLVLAASKRKPKQRD